MHTMDTMFLSVTHVFRVQCRGASCADLNIVPDIRYSILAAMLDLAIVRKSVNHLLRVFAVLLMMTGD